MLDTPFAEFAVYVPTPVNVYPGPTLHAGGGAVVDVVEVVVVRDVDVVVLVVVVVVLHDPPATRVPP